MTKRSKEDARETPKIINEEMASLIMQGHVSEFRDPITVRSARGVTPAARDPQSADEYEEQPNHSWSFFKTITPPEQGRPRRLSDRKLITTLRPPLGCIGDYIWGRESAYMRKNDDRVSFQDGALMTKDREYLPSPMWSERDNDRLRSNGWSYVQGVHVPKWGSRILLKITDVYPERLPTSEAKILAMCDNMGIDKMKSWDIHAAKFYNIQTYWDSLQKTRLRVQHSFLWEKNPLTWVYRFDVVYPRIKKETKNEVV